MPWTDRRLTLYHATTALPAWDILHEGIREMPQRPGLDFGPGFYTTSNLSQAYEWADNRADKYHDVAAIVCFECDYTAISGLLAIHFPSSGPEADDYWSFVLKMKSGMYREHVAGTGLFPLAIGGLAVRPGKRERHPDTDQYSFHGKVGLAFVNGLERDLVFPLTGDRFGK